MRSGAGAACLAVFALAGCVAPEGAEFLGIGRAPPSTRLGEHEVSISSGLYETGSRVGLALLSTVRDETGRGPSTPWAFAIKAPGGDVVAEVTYADSSDGSYSAWWWNDVPPEAGEYELLVSSTEGETSLVFDVPEHSALSPVDAKFDAPSGRITWAPVQGAAVYACEVSEGGVHLGSTSPSEEPSCDASAWGEGAFSIGVLAFSADLRGLSADLRASPALPASFLVSEERLAVAIGSAGTLTLRAAAGPLGYGTTKPALAVWVSIADESGASPAESVPVSVVLPDGTATFEYPAGAAQWVVWFYDVPSKPASVGIQGSVGTTDIGTTVEVGSAEPLPVVSGVTASPSSSGALGVSWEGVQGAASYRASVWSVATGALVASTWVETSPANFPAGTLVSGESYEVFIAASSASMASSSFSTPRPLRMSETAYSPVVITAP